MDLLNAVMRERFFDKTVAHLQEVFPEQTKNREAADLRALAEDGMKRAAAYRLTGEREVTLFIDLLMGLGPDFDSRPAYVRLRCILEDKDLAQGDKMDIVYKKLERSAR